MSTKIFAHFRRDIDMDLGLSVTGKQPYIATNQTRSSLTLTIRPYVSLFTDTSRSAARPKICYQTSFLSCAYDIFLRLREIK